MAAHITKYLKLTSTKMQSVLIVALVCIACITCDDQFEVLSITNVPFPSSSGYAFVANASFNNDIAEFTICYRFKIESYNDGWVTFLMAKIKDSKPWDSRYLYINAGYEMGFEIDGYQESHFGIERNIPGGGLGNRAHPFYHHSNLARNFETSEWYHMCLSYSSSLQTIH